MDFKPTNLREVHQTDEFSGKYIFDTQTPTCPKNWNMNFQKIAENSSVLVNLGFPYHKVIFIMAFHYFRFQCREDSKVEGVEANEE